MKYFNGFIYPDALRNSLKLSPQILSNGQFIWIGQGWMGLDPITPLTISKQNPDRQKYADIIVSQIPTKLKQALIVNKTPINTKLKGQLLLDWEGWAPNYKLQTTRPWGGEDKSDYGLTEAEYNEAMKWFWPQIIKAYKAAAPTMRVSLFNLPMVPTGLEGIKNNMSKLEIMDAELDWLYKLFGSFHIRAYFLNIGNLEAWYRNTAYRFERLGQKYSKLVNALIWPTYVGENIFVPEESLDMAFNELQICDSISILGSTKMGVKVLNTWITNELNPAVEGI